MSTALIMENLAKTTQRTDSTSTIDVAVPLISVFKGLCKISTFSPAAYYIPRTAVTLTQKYVSRMQCINSTNPVYKGRIQLLRKL